MGPAIQRRSRQPWHIEGFDGDDFATLAALHSACFAQSDLDTTAWTAAALADLLSQTGTVALLARRGERSGGLLIGRWVADEAEVLSLGVLPEARGQQAAKALLSGFHALLSVQKIGCCHLEVARENHAACGLYRSMGYELVGVREHYYRLNSGLRASAALFRKRL